MWYVRPHFSVAWVVFLNGSHFRRFLRKVCTLLLCSPVLWLRKEAYALKKVHSKQGP